MRILSTAQAAEELGISRRRVLALIKAGRLAAQRVGVPWVIMESALAPLRKRKPGRPRGKT